MRVSWSRAITLAQGVMQYCIVLYCMVWYGIVIIRSIICALSILDIYHFAQDIFQLSHAYLKNIVNDYQLNRNHTFTADDFFISDIV